MSVSESAHEFGPHRNASTIIALKFCVTLLGAQRMDFNDFGDFFKLSSCASGRLTFLVENEISLQMLDGV